MKKPTPSGTVPLEARKPIDRGETNRVLANAEQKFREKAGNLLKKVGKKKTK